MANGASQVRAGRIGWAVVADPRGGNPKRRPVIVIDAADPAAVVVMGVTTTYPDPAPEGHVPLPWNADPRRVGTRLARRSAAVVGWLAVVDSSAVDDLRGTVPPAVMAEIDRQLRAADAG